MNASKVPGCRTPFHLPSKADSHHHPQSEHKGTLRRKVAETYPTELPAGSERLLRHRGQPVTCLALASKAQHVYCGCKGGSITKWSVSSGERLVEVEGQRKGAGAHKDQHASHTRGGAAKAHTGAVLAIAISSDDKFLASGGVDRNVILWDATVCVWLRTFGGHRGAVTSLAFRRRSHQLFSGSTDRTLKVWDLDMMAYVETLYGHQDTVADIDALDRERPLSCGARDRSLRLWKLVDESQLAFEAGAHGGESIDCVAMITEDTYISGSQDGTLALWDVLKKKPVAQLRNAHGPRHWITALSAVRYGDVVASGSNDGNVRFWRPEVKQHRIVPLLCVPVEGFVNSLAFDAAGSMLFVAVAQEHRLGRWERISAARNGIRALQIIPPQ